MTAEMKVAGVVGAGTMGSGIAQVCATAGLSVIMVDVGLEQLDLAVEESHHKRGAAGTVYDADAGREGGLLIR